MGDAVLSGRHALVTGAGRGIGAVIAERLLAQGAKITLLGRSRGPLDAMIARLGDRVQAATADVSDAQQMRDAVESAIPTFGPVDILVNNAGQARSAPFHKADDALWHSMLAVNLTGAYNGIRAVLPSMIERRFGRIINVASTAGLTGYPYVTAYCAAKHGVIGLTRALAMEVVTYGITVNAVCPGYTDTDIVREAIDNIRTKTGRSAEEALQSLVANNPQRRLVRPEEVASAVAWLCHPDSEGMTGQSIAVAGGEIM